MKNITLYDDPQIAISLQPLTLTRSIADLRIGIFTIAQKWEKALHCDAPAIKCQARLQPLYPTPSDDSRLFISSHILPDAKITKAILALKPGERLISQSGELIAYLKGVGQDQDVVYAESYDAVCHPYDIFLLNGKQIIEDLAHIDRSATIATLSATNTIIGPSHNLHISPSAIIEGATINVSHGPVYIGDNVEIMEGATLRGSIAILDGSIVRMGARVYGSTTIGPGCRVGGEIDNVVFQGYSNKAHDGYLGNAVIGQWCNLGAGCTASNLKNDYSPIRLWDYATRRFPRTDLQFCGLIMGDHSKAGINTMFNTATTVGVGANIYGSGFPRVFIPSFSDGSTAGFTKANFKNFIATARKVMSRRGIELSDAEIEVLRSIYDDPQA